jgi:hypothetical protein
MAQGTSTDTTSRANLALGVSALAVVLWIVAMIVAQETNGWLWPLSGLVGAAGAITGWTAGKPRPSGKSLAAVILGGLVFAAILGWIVWAAATGNLD